MGQRTQSLQTGSHETEIKKPMSSIEGIYDAVVAPIISVLVPSELHDLLLLIRLGQSSSLELSLRNELSMVPF
ncbi:hypothetical protein VNO77_19144 [Canavalia gladiata]|uniref:Uncharacterized protein n=1 Tax=Canavalia gladiata TaxID=3824 RepID=A0AAN9LMU6_CANGL